ncbi:MAG: 2-C-methyl-D-erythritol 2,4-cyclodiphosphate synthase [Gammaproteobacteria bacterium]
MSDLRIGHGYDAHRFAIGTRLKLGGAEIDHTHGLEAHSDGDVVIHALCDALLGAAALGDIGTHFPDSQAEFENIDSRILLRRVVAALAGRGLVPVNVDLTIVAQSPRLKSHIPTMRERLSADLGLTADRVNVKATTTEGMGFTGRAEGIAAHAVALVSAAAALD